MDLIAKLHICVRNVFIWISIFYFKVNDMGKIPGKYCYMIKFLENIQQPTQFDVPCAKRAVLYAA